MAPRSLSPSLQALTQPGGGWTQYCNAFSELSDFCVDSALAASPLALRGPFVIHAGMRGGESSPRAQCVTRLAASCVPSSFFAGGCGLDVSEVSPGVNASVVLPGRVPLVRCYDGAHHYLSNDPACPPPPGSSSSSSGSRSAAPAVPDQPLGCVAAERDSNLARALRVCRAGAAPPREQAPKKKSDGLGAALPSRYLGTLAPLSPPSAVPRTPLAAPRAYPTPGPGVYYHVLDGPCGPGDADLGVLGYVR